MPSMYDLFLISSIISLVLCQDYNAKGFDDTVLYNINWPGDKLDDLNLLDTQETMIIKSSHREQYKCFLPTISKKADDYVDAYEGLTPLELIEPLFSQTSCSYRLETYWTYEVCHGRFIRQFHEDREGKKSKLQEYKLGEWNSELMANLAQELKSDTHLTRPVPTKKIDGVALPYFEVPMGNGTLCDLNQNRPRQTRLIYVCYKHGKHEVYSLKETATCQYEIVILSPFLCAHPKYKSVETSEHQIHCIPLEGASQRPHNMYQMQAESYRLRRRNSEHIEQIRVEFLPMGSTDTSSAVEGSEGKALPLPPLQPGGLVDSSPVDSFLKGKNCLNGGTGWWKYKFCYGKYVEQYHIGRDGSKTSINLGKFDYKKHIAWIENNPHKRPKPSSQRNKLSHFYADGSICDKTGKPRQTEVKLKCLENASSVNAVSLYLLEPRYCEYILGVESPLICDILGRADEDGLVPYITEAEELPPNIAEDDIPIIQV